ncbi:hypothetical protein TRFO_42153 [Tritrichomonas foetus]|uniref:Uncharacterized protein n=1 Tax=Tritrichomonas foetus TaxID=1144522 RepID=A0A1J4KXM1_9EUKA|nr:hypothetical protein TRFO_42153 [Tritrichomonas foetus]|eukprot:OHT15983.1 hypothetical protein TRFO_42153 [Tritrichomonas foetus]
MYEILLDTIHFDFISSKQLNQKLLKTNINDNYTNNNNTNSNNIIIKWRPINIQDTEITYDIDESAKRIINFFDSCSTNHNISFSETNITDKQIYFKPKKLIIYQTNDDNENNQHIGIFVDGSSIGVGIHVTFFSIQELIDKKKKTNSGILHISDNINIRIINIEFTLICQKSENIDICLSHEGK